MKISLDVGVTSCDVTKYPQDALFIYTGSDPSWVPIQKLKYLINANQQRDKEWFHFQAITRQKKRFYKTWKSHNYSLAGVLLPLPSNQSAGGCGHTGVADPRAFCCLSTRIFLYESWKRFWGFLKFEGRVENAVKRKKYYKFIGVKQNDLNQKVHVFIFQKNLWC